MLEYSAQICKADVEDHTHRINFHNEESVDPEKKFRLDNTFYFGFAGDIKVVYTYDKTQHAHLDEIARIKTWIDSRSDIMFEYELTDEEFIIIIDYDDFPKNEIYGPETYWISGLLDVTIDSYQKPALFGRIIGMNTNGSITFKHFILENSTIDIDTESEKAIITFGDPCTVNGNKKFERTTIAPFEGKAVISSDGTTYVCVLENDH